MSTKGKKKKQTGSKVQVEKETTVLPKRRTGMSSVKWVTDPIQEDVMTRKVGLEIRWGAMVSASNVDIERSKDLNVRPSEGYDEEHAMRLAILMESGAQFKAPVLWQPTRTPKCIVAHGVHRAVAAIDILGCKEIMCYMITGPDKGLANLVDTYSRVANTFDLDKAPTIEDSYLNAKYFIEKKGMTVAQAAVLVALPEGTIGKYMRQDQVDTELRESGFDTRKLSRTHLTVLSPIRNSKVRKALASVIIKQNINGQELYAYSKQVQNKDTEQGQLQEVQKIETILKTVRKPAASEMLDVRVRREWLSVCSRIFNFVQDRLTVRQIMAMLKNEPDMARYTVELGNKMLILGDIKHAEEKREAQILASKPGGENGNDEVSRNS